jgi:hypothetical protein
MQVQNDKFFEAIISISYLKLEKPKYNQHC